MHAMSALLDSLMGADRNALPEKRQNRQQVFSDSEVCKYYLVDFCPHDLFPNTRSDLGPCSKLHKDSLKEQYDSSPDKDKFAPEFEAQMMAFLEQLILQAEQKIDKANRRIDAPLPENALLSEEQQQQVDKMNQEISRLLKEAEKAGEKGDVEEAAVLTRNVQTLRKDAERAANTLYGSYMQREKSLRVCPICGAMQSVGDSMSRFESHVTGKQHIGFEKIRSCLEELRRRKEERNKAERLGVKPSIPDDNTGLHDSGPNGGNGGYNQQKLQHGSTTKGSWEDNGTSGNRGGGRYRSDPADGGGGSSSGYRGGGQYHSYKRSRDDDGEMSQSGGGGRSGSPSASRNSARNSRGKWDSSSSLSGGKVGTGGQFYENRRYGNQQREGDYSGGSRNNRRYTGSGRSDNAGRPPSNIHDPPYATDGPLRRRMNAASDTRGDSRRSSNNSERSSGGGGTRTYGRRQGANYRTPMEESYSSSGGGPAAAATGGSSSVSQNEPLEEGECFGAGEEYSGYEHGDHRRRNQHSHQHRHRGHRDRESPSPPRSDAQ